MALARLCLRRVGWLRTAVVRRNQRFLSNSAEEEAKLERAKSLISKVDINAVVRDMRKKDIAFEDEPYAKLQRMTGNLDETHIPDGTLLKKHLALLDEAEASGDGSKLTEAVEAMSSKEKLLFYTHKEHWENRPQKVDHSEIKKLSPSDWKELAEAAVIKFRKMGKALQEVDRAKEEKRVERLRRARATEDGEEPEVVVKGELRPHILGVYSEKERLFDLDESDCGKYINVSELMKSMHEGIAGGLAEEFSITKVHQLMLRKPIYRLIDRLRRIHQADIPSKESFVIGGATAGSGKSAALSTAVMFAREADWFVIYLPKAERISANGHRMFQSKVHPDLFVQPGLNFELFKEMLKTNASILKKIKLKRSYDANAELGFRPPEGTDPSELTLHDLVTFAADRQTDEHGEAVFDFFEELKLVDEVKVMVAVDNVNVWDLNSIYADFTKKKLPPLPCSQLALIHCLQQYRRPQYNGVGLFAMTSLYAAPSSHKMRRENISLMTMLKYSPIELETVLEHWMRAGILFDENVGSKSFSDIITAISGRVPREVYRAIRCL